jgi:hypothetical protein
VGRRSCTSRPPPPRLAGPPRRHRPARGQPRQRSVLAPPATSPHRPRPLQDPASVVSAHQRRTGRAYQERLARPHRPQRGRGPLPREEFARNCNPVSTYLARATRGRRPIPGDPAFQDPSHSAAYDCQPQVPLGPMRGPLLSRMPNPSRERRTSPCAPAPGRPIRPARLRFRQWHPQRGNRPCARGGAVATRPCLRGDLGARRSPNTSTPSNKTTSQPLLAQATANDDD